MGLIPTADEQRAELKRRRDEQLEVDDLRRKISKLSNGRVVTSRNLDYLRTRYADLKKRKKNGERLPNATRADHSSVVSVSLTRKRCDLLARICKERRQAGKDGGLSAVLRDAFDQWAMSNGYKVEIDHLHRMEKTDEG